MYVNIDIPFTHLEKNEIDGITAKQLGFASRFKTSKHFGKMSVVFFKEAQDKNLICENSGRAF